MSYLDDPRVYFAAERTLLAWVRTGITIMGLGFVVAKFGLFLRYLVPHNELPPHSPLLSLILGTAMVLFGTVTCVGAALQFRRFIATLSAEELPPRWSPAFANGMAYVLSLGGVVLMVYMIL